MKLDVKQGFQNTTNRLLPHGADGWGTAVLLIERWLATQERVDALLEQLAPGLPAQERARAQHLFYGVVRWAGRIEGALAGLMAVPPRTKVRAILMVAGFELHEQRLAADKIGAVAKIIHHAVEKTKTVASVKESGLVNAVARKMSARLDEAPKSLAEEFAHPEWLVSRWVKQFGADSARKLLEWNQQPAPVYARWRPSFAKASEGTDVVTVPDFLAPTQWAGFFEVKAGRWEEVRKLANDGMIYLQDPSTRLSVDLLAPQPGETILDACAAPGGKSLMIADAMQSGKLVALDEEGPRLQRLRENLSRAPKTVEVSLMPADLEKVGTVFFRDFSLPETYDAVLLDAPCSNTGVMRHRIDVKQRLQEGDFAQHGNQQLALLHAAARMVRPGGRLVYSTCSLDAQENEAVMRAFFDSRAGGVFKRDKHVLAYPWSDGHDAAGAYLLRKN